MSNPRPFHVALFRIGIALFTVAFAAGVARTVRSDGVLPPISWSQSVEVERLLAGGDLEGTVKQMRIAAQIDVTSTQQLVPILARLAHQIGDRENEIWALRQLVVARPDNASIHNALATQLLDSGDERASTLAEAERHSEIARKIDPDSAVALVNLGSVAYLRGDGETALSRWRRALEIEPNSAFRNKAIARHPALATSLPEVPVTVEAH